MSSTAQLPPAAVMIRHEVADFDAWKAAFDAHEDARAAMTAVGAAVQGGAGVVLLLRHGAVTVGRDVREATNRMELAELAAYAVLLAEDGAAAVESSRVEQLARRLARRD